MPVSFVIRDVPEDLAAAISAAATVANARSREAYLRDFLRRSFSGDASAVATVAARARAAVENFRKLGDAGVLRPAPNLASIARSLGHDDVGTLESVLRGDRPLSFSDGDRLCELLSLDEKWLDEGDASRPRFKVDPRYSDCRHVLRDFLTNGIPYEQLFFVLSEEPNASAMIIGHSSAEDPKISWRYDLLIDNIPIHDSVGATGRSQRRQFADLLVALSDIDLFADDVWCIGRILPKADCDAAMSGSTHLSAPTSSYSATNQDSRGRRSHWHEDFWTSGPSELYTASYAKARAALRTELAKDGITSDDDYRGYVQKRLDKWTAAS